jgi:hypothetical protein
MPPESLAKAKSPSQEREKGQEGKPKGKKNHHKQKHERLLMLLVTKHYHVMKTAPHPEQGTSQ